MELFHRVTKIDFMGMRKFVALLSVVVTICAGVSLFTKGLNFGLDFTGGTQLELRYESPVDASDIRELLTQARYERVKVTHYGSTRDILVRLGHQEQVSEEALSKNVLDVLQATPGTTVELRRIEFVGSEVGQQLAEQGSLAVIVALIATMIYIAFRFEYRFAISAAVALMHDPIVILGIFSYFQLEFDLATLAGILAVMGYSINDTIVVYDRVRENFRKYRKGEPADIMNDAINQTLSRTLMTSFMTLLVVVALLLVGGESLRGFSTALCIGIVVGTYSSIYIAGALALTMGLTKQDLAEAKRVTGEVV